MASGVITWIQVIYLGWLMILPILCFSSTSSEYAKGLEAFKHNHFEEAVEYFEMVLLESPDDVLVLHNLAIAHFKLGEYLDAKNYLSELLFLVDNTVEYSKILYTLGVIEKKLENIDGAILLFKEVSELPSQYSGPANAQLDILLSQTSQPKKTAHLSSIWFNNINMGYGFDNGVLDPISEEGGEGDQYVDLSLSTTWKSNKGRSHWYSDVVLYTTQYNDVDEYNLNFFSIGVGRSQSLGKGALHVYSNLQKTVLAGEDYQRYFRYGLKYKAPLSDSISWRLRYQGKIIAYLQALCVDDGLGGQECNKVKDDNAHRIDTSLKFNIDKANKLSIKYQFDRYYQAAYSESSKTSGRHMIKAWWQRSLPYEIVVQVSGNYRISDYKNAYMRQSSEGSQQDSELKRDDSRFSFGVEFTKQIKENVLVSLGYQSSKNSSSIESYDYNQAITYTYLDWSF